MTVDYKSLKVSDIKRLILDENLLDEESVKQIQAKGKSEWVQVHQELTSGFKHLPKPIDEVLIFDENEEDDDNYVSFPEPPNIDIPRYYDPGWHDFIMSQFEDEELIDGKYPNVNALRRMVEKWLGPIVSSGPIETQATMDPNVSGKAVVTYEVVIEWRLDARYEGSINLNDPDIFPNKIFRSVASSHINNTDDVYVFFPESIAETRAEGRALRRALRLGVVCSDELTSKDPVEIVRQQQEMATTTGEWDADDLIKDQQINTIIMLCERLKIDLNKFINSGSQQYDKINDVSRQAAAGMLKRLNQYQSAGSDSLDIPLDILIGGKE